MLRVSIVTKFFPFVSRAHACRYSNTKPLRKDSQGLIISINGNNTGSIYQNRTIPENLTLLWRGSGGTFDKQKFVSGVAEENFWSWTQSSTGVWAPLFGCTRQRNRRSGAVQAFQTNFFATSKNPPSVLRKSRELFAN